jgi:hypothetical protein
MRKVMGWGLPRLDEGDFEECDCCVVQERFLCERGR